MLRFNMAGMAAILALSAASAFGQTTTVPPNEGAYDSLSTGQQKIVDSLYASQSRALQPSQTSGTTTASPAPWTKNDIAAAKGQTGWGQVFKNMQSQGLVSDKNLGQAISFGQHNKTALPTAPASSAAPAPRHAPVAVTYGNGNSATYTQHSSRANAPSKQNFTAGSGQGHRGHTAMTTTQTQGPVSTARGGSGHSGGHGKSGK